MAVTEDRPTSESKPAVTLEPIVPEPPLDFDCEAVCNEYAGNLENNVEMGFTCDATICTTPPVGFSIKDPFLFAEACGGLGKDAPISKIAALELVMGCSCCAS